MKQLEGIQQAADLVRSASNIVVLTGAGISTPSGIPDFRSPESGLWDNAEPMVVASIQAFQRDSKPFFNWFRPLLSTLVAAQPNPAHEALATLEAAGKVRAIVTQNIDGLHQRAGSQTVHELHGHVRTVVCMSCQQVEPAEFVIDQFMNTGEVPYHHCGGILKPSVIFFGEALPRAEYAASVAALEQADFVFVIGSSMEVAPASELPLLALDRGAKLAIINLVPTYLDSRADVVIHHDVADALPRLVKLALD